jgi:hypothetical protein
MLVGKGLDCSSKMGSKGLYIRSDTLVEQGVKSGDLAADRGTRGTRGTVQYGTKGLWCFGRSDLTSGRTLPGQAAGCKAGVARRVDNILCLRSRADGRELEDHFLIAS